MTSYKHQYDVIGPICSGYVPFCPVVTDCATAISCVEVARLEEPVHVLDFRQSFYCEKTRLKRPPAAGIEPRSPRTKFLRSERSTTELAGPGAE